MKSLGYYLAIILLLGMMIIIAIAMMHLEWWGALLLVLFAAFMLSQTQMMWLALASPLRHRDLDPRDDCGILVDGIERTSEQPDGEVVRYRAEVVVTPRASDEAAAKWDATQLTLWPEIEIDATLRSIRQYRRGRGMGALGGIYVKPETIEVAVDGEFVPLRSALLSGEQRLRVTFVLEATARKMSLQVSGGSSLDVRLPGDDPRHDG